MRLIEDSKLAIIETEEEWFNFEDILERKKLNQNREFVKCPGGFYICSNNEIMYMWINTKGNFIYFGFPQGENPFGECYKVCVQSGYTAELAELLLLESM